MFSWLFAIPFFSAIAKALGVVLEFLTPIAKVIGEGIANGARILGTILLDGFRDIVDAWKTIVTVFILMSSSFVYGHYFYDREGAKARAVAEFRKDYKFIPRTKKEKKNYRLPDISNPLNFDWLWR